MLVPQLNFLGSANLNLNPFLQPENSPVVLNGVVPTYKLGALLKDVGYSQVGDAIEAGKPVTGHFDFHQSPTVQKELVTINNAAGTNLVLAYNNAGTWTDINISTSWDAFEDCKVEMAGFIGYCFFVGYDSTDNVFLPVGSLTGTTFSTSTNVTSMPQAKYIIRYRDRLYIAHCFYSGTKYEFRVYFSSIPSAGAITWTPASDFLDVDFGEQITGLSTNWDRLVVFTEHNAYMYDQSIWKQAFAYGCSAHRTIQNHGPYMIWANYDGVWMSTGGQPQNIAGPVIDFIRNGSPRDLFATIVDEKYVLYVGTVTVDSITYSNCELVFDVPTSIWYWRENYDNFTTYARYNNAGVMERHMGCTDGEVMKKGKHSDTTLISSDDGQPIGVNFELPPIHLSMFDGFKGVKKLIAYAKKSQGLKLKYRIIDRNTTALTPYMKLGELTKYVNSFDISSSESGVLIQVAGSEYSTNEYFEFYGCVLDIIKESKVYASTQKHN
ncbi:MAG: hypothetical protein KKD77_22395 [Gammaproteobacteria bacterium]|nr:hypothetical protein [Gammaproteobacteria bacterium]